MRGRRGVIRKNIEVCISECYNENKVLGITGQGKTILDGENSEFVEAHGSHLPLGTDIFAALNQALEMICRELRCLIFVPVWYGKKRLTD